MDQARIKERAEELLGRSIESPRIVEDTSQFMELGMGDVLLLEGRHFVLRGLTYEGRFGLDEQPKHWVRTGFDLADGSAKIIKMVFFEEFDLPVGQLMIHCFRSPRKEQRVLDTVRGHPLFMQGETLFDLAGNPVRVIDRIRGQSLHHHLGDQAMDHAEYFRGQLPDMLERFVAMVEAIGFLHSHQLVHGDIRRDHIFLDKDSGLWRWIDFDYNYNLPQNPFGLDLFGLGNVLCYLVGQGIPTLHQLNKDRPEALDRLDTGDLSLVIPNRVFNLKKLYPYIPESLNRVLMHFAAAAPVFYEQVAEFLADLRQAAGEVSPGSEEVAS